MEQKRTEARHDKADGLDIQPAETVLRLLADAQIDAATAVRDAIGPIAEAAAVAARSLSSGGRLVYAAAGSSGLMALADGLELPGTFGIARDRVVILIAGGVEALRDMTGAPEDDAAQAVSDIAASGLAAGDCLIVLSASGSTPYALGALREANGRGAHTIAIANNEGTPLLVEAGTAILLRTPPEIIAGSTRMGAGTAQKIALNMLSTMTAIELGHVHDGYMVNVHADNQKLRQRAASMVSAIAGCGEEEARRVLALAGGAVKPAVLLAAGAAGVEAARELLDATGQRLRGALSHLQGGGRQGPFPNEET